jgi:hypothetical protein
MTQEQLDILNEVRVKMFYDPKKTLSEQETRFTRDLDRTFSTPESAKKYMEEIEPYKHEILQLAAFGSAFIPLVGLPIAGALELADASIYLSEDDPYMAGLSMAFSLLGLNQIPALKNYSKDFILKTIKKSRANYKLTKQEVELLKIVSKNIKEIELRALSNLITKKVVTMPLSQMILHLAKLSKKFPKIFNLGSLIFQVGTTYITYDTLAKYFGILPGKVSDSDMEKIKNINKSDFNV